MNVNSIENELIILTKQTIDVFLKSDSPGDLLALYSFYYYTAKWQGTNQPKCTTSYAARGLKWSEAKVRKAKRDLMSLGLIEDIVSKGADGKITSHYVRLRYIIKQSTLANLHTDEMPQGGKYNTVEEQGTNAFSADSVNALSSRNGNALNYNPSTTCKDYMYADAYPQADQPKKVTRPKINYQEIADMYNTICTSLPRVTALSDKRKEAIAARFKHYTVDQFREMFAKAEASPFLKGGNDRNWTANFDWLLKDANFAKVIDGNYDPKENTGGQGYNQQNNYNQPRGCGLQEQYNSIARVLAQMEAEEQNGK